MPVNFLIGKMINQSPIHSDTAPKKKLGQNFLINDDAARRIVEQLNLLPSDTVLEIGAGKGALTKHLLKKCKEVIAVEIDQRMCQFLKENFSDYANLRIVSQDILQLDIKKYAHKGSIKIAGNIPYHLTAPIVSLLIDNRDSISTAILTVQKEVAERICAKPDTKDWSLLSILIQLYADAKLLFILKPGWFYPLPKVHSAVVKLSFLHNPRVEIEDMEHFFKLTRMMFQQKRKMIAGSLAFGTRLSKPELKQKLEKAGIDFSLRPQALSLEKLATICSVLK